MIAELIVASVSFLGLIAGLIIMRLAKEEQRSGMPYFFFLKKGLISLILFFFLYFQSPWLAFMCAPVLALFLHRRIKLPRDWFIAFLIGIVFVFSTKNESLLIINAALTFFYFMVVSSIEFNKRKLIHMAATNVWFFLPHLLLLVI